MVAYTTLWLLTPLYTLLSAANFIFTAFTSITVTLDTATATTTTEHSYN
jgi:hypothetical protein